MISYLALAAALQAAPGPTPVPARPSPIRPLPMVPALPAPPPPVAEIIRAQRVRYNLGEYFSIDDYPGVMLRARTEGVVHFVLAITPDGRVGSCTVTRSSGSPELDGATCQILRRRARYLPVRDARGNPAAGRDWGSLYWSLAPASRDPALPWQVVQIWD